MRKIVILLGIILFMIACEKGNEEVREAKVVVFVYDENGKKCEQFFCMNVLNSISLLDRKRSIYLPSKWDKRKITVIKEWFAAQSQRFFTFVVQEGGGPDNYQIWSSGRTVEAGKVVKIEIRLTQFPN